MQGCLQFTAFLASRGLCMLTAASQYLAHGLLSPSVTSAQCLPTSDYAVSGTTSTSETALHWGCRAFHTSASNCRDDAVALRSGTASSNIPASIVSQRSPLLLDGSRAADPGEPRYTAPYWIPEDVRKANHLPQVLFTDPWNPHDEPETRSGHARLCYDLLLHSPRPLTAEQVRDAVNDRLRDLHQRHAGGSGAATADAVPPPPPLLATTAYVKHLLEHMRRTRLLYGKKNPDSMLSGGHPEHPRLYYALKYQAARYGDPQQLAEHDAARREKQVARAFKRLRHGKPPYAIHRRRAYFSLWQHEEAQEALRGGGPGLPTDAVLPLPSAPAAVSN